jgi:nucleoside-diphosphate-sugar epimerase
VPKPLAKVGAWVKGHLPFAGEPLLKPRMIDRVDDHYELDISRARRLLGWKPKHALGDTLGDMVAALKADPIIWYGDNKLEEAAQPAGSRED